MVSLLDLKRRSVDVETSSGTVTMHAVSIGGIAHLVSKFPIVKKLVDGNLSEEDFTVEGLLAMAPELVAELIAAGANEAGNVDYISAAANAAIGDQVALLAGVMEASMPKGPAPFRDAFSRLAVGLGFGNGTKESASDSPKPRKRS